MTMSNSVKKAPAIPQIQPAKMRETGQAWVVELPRLGEEGTHFHTYGLLTPYFKGLTEGRLMATRCTYLGCPISRGKGELWLPPRADCPDCHQPMVWQQVENPRGYIYTYTLVERGGTGLELPTPYFQIDVKIEGLCTIVKSYLVGPARKIKIGDKVRARFRTGVNATHTALDLYFELE
jgi:uncharacterized OB-fold protein